MPKIPVLDPRGFATQSGLAKLSRGGSGLLVLLFLLVVTLAWEGGSAVAGTNQGTERLTNRQVAARRRARGANGQFINKRQAASRRRKRNSDGTFLTRRQTAARARPRGSDGHFIANRSSAKTRLNYWEGGSVPATVEHTPATAQTKGKLVVTTEALKGPPDPSLGGDGRATFVATYVGGRPLRLKGATREREVAGANGMRTDFKIRTLEIEIPKGVVTDWKVVSRLLGRQTTGGIVAN